MAETSVPGARASRWILRAFVVLLAGVVLLVVVIGVAPFPRAWWLNRTVPGLTRDDVIDRFGLPEGDTLYGPGSALPEFWDRRGQPVPPETVELWSGSRGSPDAYEMFYYMGWGEQWAIVMRDGKAVRAEIIGRK